MVAKLASMKRSTQLARHVCSPLSSALLLMLPVTHFFQQRPVSSWVSASVVFPGREGWLVSLRFCCLFFSLPSLYLPSGGRERRERKPARTNYIRDWIRARCSSLAKNWRSSDLSLSLSLSRSDCSMEKSVEEDMLLFLRKRNWSINWSVLLRWKLGRFGMVDDVELFGRSWQGFITYLGERPMRMYTEAVSRAWISVSGEVHNALLLPCHIEFRPLHCISLSLCQLCSYP